MNEFELLSIFVLFISNAAQSFVTISNVHNRFEIHPSGRVTQRIYSSEWPNSSAAYDSSLDSMELLRNIRILAPNRRSCIVNEQLDKASDRKRRTFQQNANISTEGIIFTEVAKVKNMLKYFSHIHAQFRVYWQGELNAATRGSQQQP